jgi:hypothetical protein
VAANDQSTRERRTADDEKPPRALHTRMVIRNEVPVHERCVERPGSDDDGYDRGEGAVDEDGAVMCYA